jgi:hypothetical protein
MTVARRFIAGSGTLCINAKIIVWRAFVPEGQADSSQAQSAWVAMQRGLVPEGRSKSLPVPQIFVVETVASGPFCSLNIHCIFSTKERAPMLNPELRERLWPFLGGIPRQKRYHAQMASAGLQITFSASLWDTPAPSAHGLPHER